MTVPSTTYILLLLLSVPLAQDPTSRPASAESRPAQVGRSEPDSRVFAPSPARVVEEHLGLELAVTESKIRRRLIQTKTPYGLKIRSVVAGSPAAKAGLAEGDIVMTAGGRPVYEVADLARAVTATQPGAGVELERSRRKQPAKLLSRSPWEDFTVELVLPAK